MIYSYGGVVRRHPSHFRGIRYLVLNFLLSLTILTSIPGAQNVHAYVRFYVHIHARVRAFKLVSGDKKDIYSNLRIFPGYSEWPFRVIFVPSPSLRLRLWLHLASATICQDRRKRAKMEEAKIQL